MHLVKRIKQDSFKEPPAAFKKDWMITRAIYEAAERYQNGEIAEAYSLLDTVCTELRGELLFFNNLSDEQKISHRYIEESTDIDIKHQEPDDEDDIPEEEDDGK